MECWQFLVLFSIRKVISSQLFFSFSAFVQPTEKFQNDLQGEFYFTFFFALYVAHNCHLLWFLQVEPFLITKLFILKKNIAHLSIFKRVRSFNERLFEFNWNEWFEALWMLKFSKCVHTNFRFLNSPKKIKNYTF